MSTIDIDTQAARTAVQTLSMRTGLTVGVSTALQVLQGSLSILSPFGAFSAVYSLLSESKREVDDIEADVARLVSTVSSAIDAYEVADGGSSGGGVPSVLGGLFSDPRVLEMVGPGGTLSLGIGALGLFLPTWAGFGDTEGEGSLLHGEGTVKYGSSTLTGFGDLLGFETKTEVKSGLKSTLEGDDDPLAKFNIFDVKGSADGYLARGGTTLKDEFGEAELKGYIGRAGVEGEAQLGLVTWDEKKQEWVLNPALVLGGKAYADGLFGSVDQQVGNDDYNVHGSLEGSVGHAEAGAKAQVSKEGVKLEASAEAAVFSGEAKSGFTLFGIDFDVGVEGNAIAVGGEASLNASSEGVSAKIGGSLGVGGAISVDIDWSDADFPSLDEIGDAVGDGMEAAGEWFSDVGDAVSDGLEDAGDWIGSTWNGIWSKF